MGLKDLSTAEMLDISGVWLEASTPGGGLIAKTKSLSNLVVFVQEAHDGLSQSQIPAANPNEKKLKELADKNVKLDRRHDAVARCIIRVLGGLAEGAKNSERRELYLDTSAALFPDGLASTQKSYAGQAGNAAEVDKRLEPKHRELLASIVTPDGKLSEHVARWRKRAKELGDSDKERTRLAAEKTDGVTKGDVVEARNQWIRAADVLVRAIPLAKLSEEDALKITQGLTKATDRATRRGGKSEGAEGEEVDTAGDEEDDVPEGDQG